VWQQNPTFAKYFTKRVFYDAVLLQQLPKINKTNGE
jgi:hypothetical protein